MFSTTFEVLDHDPGYCFHALSNLCPRVRNHGRRSLCGLRLCGAADVYLSSGHRPYRSRLRTSPARRRTGDVLVWLGCNLRAGGVSDGVRSRHLARTDNRENPVVAGLVGAPGLVAFAHPVAEILLAIVVNQ